MIRFALLFLLLLPIAHGQSARETFFTSLDRFAREHEQMRPQDVDALARAAFESSPDEIVKKIDAWLDALPPFLKRDGYVLAGEYGHALTQEEVDVALKTRPTASALFMQAVSPESLAYLAVNQTESLGMRKEKQSFQFARVYIHPCVELISRSAKEVHLAIYDFDVMIEVTAVRSSVGILCPSIYRLFKKEANQALVPTPMSGTPAAGAPVAPATGAAHL